MLIADLEGMPLIEIAIRNTPVSLTMEQRRHAMLLVRELRTLGFIDAINPCTGGSDGSENDRPGVTLSA